MKQAFNDEVYDTANALLLARHELPSGIEALRGQRVFDLYRTPSGSYFKYGTTASLFIEDEEPEIIPISEEEAQSLYEELDDRRCELQDAFSAACLGIR
ncbi:MAG: hypothetical protein ACXVIG_07220 [Halobacteriota archaeon]